jgi:hypothetical protein
VAELETCRFSLKTSELVTVERMRIGVPVRNEIGSETGLVALRWYARRPKLPAALQRITYQNS